MPPERPEGAGAFPKPVERAVPLSPDPAALYAALELGTDSCRMLIAQPKGNQFHVIDSFSKSVQLGQGLEKSGRLSRAALDWINDPENADMVGMRKKDLTKQLRKSARRASRRAAKTMTSFGTRTRVQRGSPATTRTQ